MIIRAIVTTNSFTLRAHDAVVLQAYSDEDTTTAVPTTNAPTTVVETTNGGTTDGGTTSMKCQICPQFN